MVLEKCIIWTKKGKIMKYMALCGTYNRNYAARLKKALNLLVA